MKHPFLRLAFFGLLALTLSPSLQARTPSKVPEELRPYIERVHADQLALRDAGKNHDKAAMAAAQKQIKTDIKALRDKQRQLQVKARKP